MGHRVAINGGGFEKSARVFHSSGDPFPVQEPMVSEAKIFY